jgi:hypothetical protein
MAIGTVYDTSVKSKDFQVYLFEGAYAESALVALLADADDTAGIEALAGGMLQIGELRKDSIVNTIGEGNSVEGNNRGKIIIDKAGSLEFEIINRNKALLTELEAIDGATVCVLKVTKDFTQGMFYKDLPFNFNESVTGGEVGKLMISFKKNVDSPDDFSTILPA